MITDAYSSASSGPLVDDLGREAMDWNMLAKDIFDLHCYEEIDNVIMTEGNIDVAWG